MDTGDTSVNIQKTMEAISSLAPNVGFRYDDTGITNWYSSSVSQPTEAEIDAEIIRLQEAYDDAAYQRSRANEYPSIGDQLDMIYHNGDGGATFQAAIKAVKDKYPKE